MLGELGQRVYWRLFFFDVVASRLVDRCDVRLTEINGRDAVIRSESLWTDDFAFDNLRQKFASDCNNVLSLTTCMHHYLN